MRGEDPIHMVPEFYFRADLIAVKLNHFCIARDSLQLRIRNLRCRRNSLQILIYGRNGVLHLAELLA